MHSHINKKITVKITISKLKRIIKEAITASDKGVVDFPDEERVPTMPGGSAVKLSAMPDLIKDLVSSEESDFVDQGLELGDTSYGFDDGTTKKAVEEEKLSFVRAAMGEDYKALSKGNLRHLSRLVGKKVFSSSGYFEWTNSSMSNTYPSSDQNKGEELLSVVQILDIMDELQEFGKYKTYTAAEDRLHDVVVKLVNVLCVATWEIGSWVGPDGFVNRGTETVGHVNDSGGTLRRLEKYNIELLNPEYKLLRDKGKFIISGDFQIFMR